MNKTTKGWLLILGLIVITVGMFFIFDVIIVQTVVAGYRDIIFMTQIHDPAHGIFLAAKGFVHSAVFGGIMT